jgi:hypothetical protein
MLLVGTSALLPACLLFTSLDDASGGPNPSSGEGGTPDVLPPSEASAAADGPTDAVPGTDAGFCGPTALPGEVFCTEFAGPTVSEGWSGLAGGVGTLELDQGNLRASVPVLAQYEQGKHVYRTIDGSFSTLSCSFAFRRDVLGEEDVSIAEMSVETSGEDYQLTLYTLPATGRLLVQRYPEDGGDNVGEETPADLAPATGQWHRVTLEVSTAQLRVYLDGQLSGSLPNRIPAAEIRTTFRLGVPQIDGDNLAPWELRFDDVRCILIP